MENYSVENLISQPPYMCKCGKTHSAHLKKAVVKENALDDIPSLIKEFGRNKAFVVCDSNTFSAAGEKVTRLLKASLTEYKLFVFSDNRTEPDEKAIGSLIYHFDYSCNIILGIGSGVINDLCKILKKLTGLPYIIAGTAPSMDGYASSTSSVVRNGLKVSVDSACPDVIVGDTSVLCKAPPEMLWAGFGDMLAKYVSVCEWRIGNVVTGEYYCSEVAAIIRAALKTITDNICGLKNREPEAVKAVMDGLILSGIAADYAGVSRPVSGVEHYFSHLWDMRFLEFGTPWSLHGIQCGIGTYLAALEYEKIKKVSPDKKTAEKNFSCFDKAQRISELRNYLGHAGDVIIETLDSSNLYDEKQHKARLEKICENWDEILNIIEEELPSSDKIKNMLEYLGAPVLPDDIGISSDETYTAFKTTKNIRDKYILSSLEWDMGIL